MRNDYTFTAGTTAGVIIVLCCLSPLQARICGSVHITSDHKSFETALKNCTVILGYLKVVTVELANETVLNQLSFPELTEVTDYVAIFFVKSLRSVGKLFPNLRIIRGESFIHDYSLIIYQNNDLEEIGLYNLMYIGRGGVIIDKNPRLCYVDTIDWHSIGASKFDYSAVDSEYCKEQCDPSCNGHCWNARYCQIVNPEGCHRECIGCTEFGSPKHCLLCKNMENDGECVRECPKDKFTHQNYKRCISAVECEILLDGAYLTFNGTCRSRCPTGYVRVPSSEGNCRSCGDHCVTYCRPLVINSFAKLQRFYGCTHVNGSLEIRISDAAIVPELPNYLSSIREIKGSLIIARSKAITSLEFLKSLKVINGSRLENNRYSIFVYENPDLKKLWDFNNFSLTIRHGNLTFFNNPLLCTEEIDKLANLTNFDNYTNAEVLSMSNGDESDCNTSDINTRIFVNSTNATISWDEPDEIKGNESVITYAIYFARKADQSLQKESVCEVRSWNSSYISNNSFFMENLIPNTEYIFYIKTMTQEKNMLKSRTKSFITLSDDPDEPEEFEAISYSYDSIKLIWLPPLNPNGVLKSWHISVYVIPDNETYLGERNYCENPHKSTVSNDLMMENETFNGPNCCSKKKQVEMFLHEMYAFCDIRGNSIYNYENRACFNYLYSPDIPAYERDDFNEIESLISDNSTYREIAVNDGNATEYIIDGLKPFTSHVFFLSVCNENHTERQQCSPVLMSFSRTHKLETADDIKYITYEMKENSVIIRWEEPEEPNSILLAYTIQHKRTDLDHSSVLSHCITRDQFLKNNGMFVLTNLEPGEYMTRIQATSLPGKGRFSRHLRFIIPDNSVQSEWWSILTSVALMIIIISLIAFYLYYRRKHVADNIHLITNVNPDYAAPIYEEDEWEIDREDIDMNDKELGQGVFGKVYIGFLKSKGINCAIKTVNDNATENSISSFLYEANVMKSFNSHHVIRLIGVVSRGYPPLVLMELMLRGDLKTFLRKSRDSSQCITSVEMYKMAIEIADGMAYLTAKKFVHRDLAARNCMVAQDGTVKIGDFGMARDIYETDYYRKETRGLLPVRWMSPESLADGVFTSDSDVWSYGVVLWEMATLAEQPYQGLANDQVLQFVIGRGKLQRPTECPDLLYEIMQECWQWSPSKRPLFLDIVDKLQNFVGENFKLVSFFHSREGEEHRMNTKQKVYNPPAMGLQMPLGAYCRFNADDDMVMTFHEDQNLLNTKLLPTKGKKSSRPRPTSSKKAVTFRSVGDDFEN